MASKEHKQTKLFWSDHIEKWKATELTQVAYCHLNDLCPHKFSYRKRQQSSLIQKIPNTANGFTRVIVDSNKAQTNESGLVIRFNDGTRIEGITTDNLILVQPLLAELR